MDDLMCECCGWQGPDVAITDDGTASCVLCLDTDHEQDGRNFLDEMIEFGGEG